MTGLQPKITTCPAPPAADITALEKLILIQGFIEIQAENADRAARSDGGNDDQSA